MLYRRLSPNGDYTFGAGRQNYLSGADAVAQAIKTRLLLLQGEWWEDTAEGLPLFQSILGQPGTPENLQAIDLLIQDRIVNTEGVTGINSFSSTYSSQTRQYGVSCVVTTASGTATVEVTL